MSSKIFSKVQIGEKMLNSNGRKEELIRKVIKFSRNEEGCKLLIIVNNLQERSIEISRSTVELVQRCNCEQADARMIFVRGMLMRAG